MHNAARMWEQARALEMETNALLVTAAMMRVYADRLPAGQVRRFLFEQAALIEESAQQAPAPSWPAESLPAALRAV
jgi:hypothetical protein